VDKDQLREVLEKHKLWLDSGKTEGERANLQCANLREANLQCANLREADLYGAYLRDADLRGADLREADLRRASLDFSCLSLSCGGLRIKADRRLVAQIAFHLAALDVSECEDAEVVEAMEAFRAMPMAAWFKEFRSDV
jgi:uncharacterized protein YjbI with pentapeptide repeats